MKDFADSRIIAVIVVVWLLGEVGLSKRLHNVKSLEAICQHKIRVESTEAQYLILNALETLELLQRRVYDPEQGFWIIETPSSVLPIAFLLPNGEIVPITWFLES